MSIEFILDGRTVTAEPGQTILEVATANGIKIPTLCRESRISKTTSCFVCVVRDRKTGRYMPSCAAVPAPGQEIEASTPEVLDMRKTALNLLLSEHSGDCEAPCTLACPAHANVEEYVRAGRKGEFLESLKIIKERIPLPMTMGGAMYYTGKAPDGTPIRVNRGLAERRQQIGVLKKRRSGNAKNSDPARRCWEKGKKR